MCLKDSGLRARYLSAILNSQHKLGHLYNHLVRKRVFTLKMTRSQKDMMKFALALILKKSNISD
jgi:hypothetical protein